jgi:hypothetical protein
MMKQQNTAGDIAIHNAGIVLICGYIPTLFSRLNLTSENTFVDTQSQNGAAIYLQYLASGLTRTEEEHLSLNKILTGLPLSQAAPHVNIDEAQEQLIESLLSAVIAHWPAIGDSSISGFRENWLLRNGTLSEQEDKWELRVEKRPYDMLIHKSSFSFSIIKYPWMNKPLHVVWVF